MNRQYGFINQCLQEIKQCDMPDIEKVHIETQFIKMKKLLIDAAMSNVVKCGSDGKDTFEELLIEVQRMCCGSYEGDALNNLMTRIDYVLADLGKGQATR